MELKHPSDPAATTPAETPRGTMSSRTPRPLRGAEGRAASAWGPDWRRRQALQMAGVESNPCDNIRVRSGEVQASSTQACGSGSEVSFGRSNSVQCRGAPCCGSTTVKRGSCCRARMQRCKGTTASRASPCNNQFNAKRSSKLSAAARRRRNGSGPSIRSAREASSLGLDGSNSLPSNAGSRRRFQPSSGSGTVPPSLRINITQGLKPTGSSSPDQASGVSARNRLPSGPSRVTSGAAAIAWSCDGARPASQPSLSARRSVDGGQASVTAAALLKGANVQGEGRRRRQSAGRVSAAALRVGTALPRLQPLRPAAAVRAASWRKRRRFSGDSGGTAAFMV